MFFIDLRPLNAIWYIFVFWYHYVFMYLYFVFILGIKGLFSTCSEMEGWPELIAQREVSDFIPDD